MLCLNGSAGNSLIVPDNQPELPCADKMIFDSEAEAKAEANKLEWQRGVKLKAYKCRHCGLWHLSSNPG